MRMNVSVAWSYFLLLLVVVGCGTTVGSPAAPQRGPNAGADLVQNGGFEEPGSPAPQGWFVIEQAARKGRVSSDRTQSESGRSSLKLEPNRQNSGDPLLSVGQAIPAAAYRGREVEFSAYVRTEGQAVALLGMLSIVNGRPANFVPAGSQPTSSPDWVRLSATYQVPDDPSVQLVISCTAAGQSGGVWFDTVSVRLLSPEAGAADSEEELQASVVVNAGTVVRRIPRTLYGANVEWIWNGNGLWQEGQRRTDPVVGRLAREAGVSLIRYPGGLYSDFYHWKNGVGPFQNRPEMRHDPSKNDRSRANLGTDEVLGFAGQINGELLITVNAGTGTAQEAAEWVRHVNGESTQVRFWEVGNELYINDGSPISRQSTVSPTQYVTRFLEFARAMRAVDPDIQIGAIGGENYGRYAFVNYPNWNRTVLERAGDEIDFLAVHNAYAPGVFSDGSQRDVRTVYRAMLAAPVLIARNLKTIEQQIQRYVPDRASEIGIAVTEWGPLFQYDFRGRYVDHNKTLGSALYAASTLKAFVESPQTQIANFFLLNDYSVLGWIGSRNGDFPPKPDWAPTARLHAFQLFTRHFGEDLVESETVGPTFDSQAVGIVDAVRDVPYLEVVSSLSQDGRRLYVLGINKHFDNAIEASISLRGFRPASSATAWTLGGTGIDAHTGTTVLRVPGLSWGRQAEAERNPRFSRRGGEEITFSSSTVSGIGTEFTYRFPPHSVTSLIMTRTN